MERARYTGCLVKVITQEPELKTLTRSGIVPDLVTLLGINIKVDFH